MDIFDITDSVLSSPALYIEKKEVTLLKAFLDGFSACERLNGKNEKNINRLFPLGFEHIGDYISMRLGNYSALGWNGVLLDFYKDEETAFDAFSVLYNEFRGLKMNRASRAELNIDNRYHNDSMKYGFRQISEFEKIPLFDRPVSVCIVELTGNNGYLLLIETEDKIEIDRAFLSSVDEAQERIQTYFGYVKDWKQVGAGKDNIAFNKPIH